MSCQQILYSDIHDSDSSEFYNPHMKDYVTNANFSIGSPTYEANEFDYVSKLNL